MIADVCGMWLNHNAMGPEKRWDEGQQNEWKKRSERRKHCARAGCSNVRTPPARPPRVRTDTHTHADDHKTLRLTARR